MSNDFPDAAPANTISAQSNVLRRLTDNEFTLLAGGRLRACLTMPFLSSALLALQPVAAVGLGTFAVDDRWRLYIDPEQLASWTVKEVAAVLLHEVTHVVRGHGERRPAAVLCRSGNS